MSRPKTRRGDGQGAGRGPSVAQSLGEYGRGLAGGMLFALPLLYTMEVWEAGFTASPARLLANFAAAFVVLLGYNRFAGLRRDTGWSEVLIDSIEELGIGVVMAALVLWLLGRVTADMPADVIVGRVVVEALTIAVGVSVGTAQLGGRDDGDSGMGGDERGGEAAADGRGAGERENAAARPGGDSSGDSSGEEGEAARGGDPSGGGGRGSKGGERISFVGQLVIAFCGAILFAANVAPTEEIVMLGAEMSSARAVGLAVFSLLFAALVLYFSEFRGAERLAPAGDHLSVLAGTVVTYAVALVAAAFMLWSFGRFGGQAAVVSLAQTVVLGVAATLGASAGRLLLQR